MSKIEMYERALKHLAEKGNIEAALVLQMANAYDNSDASDAKTELAISLGYAADNINAALTAAERWNVTESIKTTGRHITAAFQHLARM